MEVGFPWVSSCELKYTIEIPSKLTHFFPAVSNLCNIFLFTKGYLCSSSLTFLYPILEEENVSIVYNLKKTDLKVKAVRKGIKLFLTRRKLVQLHWNQWLYDYVLIHAWVCVFVWNFQLSIHLVQESQLKTMHLLLQLERMVFYRLWDCGFFAKIRANPCNFRKIIYLRYFVLGKYAYSILLLPTIFVLSFYRKMQNKTLSKYLKKR